MRSGVARPLRLYAWPEDGGIFVWIMVGVFALLLVLILLLGIFYPGSGAEQLDWRPTRSPELEAQNEEDDLTQMLAATNAKRRARGERELTEATMHDRVREDRDLRAKLRGGDDGIAEEREQLRLAREARAARRAEREREKRGE